MMRRKNHSQQKIENQYQKENERHVKRGTSYMGNRSLTCLQYLRNSDILGQDNSAQ